jgi:hypothetical protein
MKPLVKYDLPAHHSDSLGWLLMARVRHEGLTLMANKLMANNRQITWHEVRRGCGVGEASLLVWPTHNEVHVVVKWS